MSAPQQQKLWKSSTTDKIKTLNYAVDNWQSFNLGLVDFSVWGVLFRHEWDGWVTFSQREIARALGANVKTVSKSIQRMVKAEILRIEKQGSTDHPGAERFGVIGSRSASVGCADEYHLDSAGYYLSGRCREQGFGGENFVHRNQRCLARGERGNAGRHNGTA